MSRLTEFYNECHAEGTPLPTLRFALRDASVKSTTGYMRREVKFDRLLVWSFGSMGNARKKPVSHNGCPRPLGS